MITNITTQHDAAWAIQTDKIELKEEISDLSAANQEIIYGALNEAQVIIDGLHAMATSSGDSDLKKRTTKTAILATIAPTPVKLPRNRYIDGASGLVIATNYVAKDLFQIRLLTNDAVSLYRCEHKTDPPVAGLDLVLNELWEGKLADIPGTGKYVKLYNATSNHTAIISLLKIKVKNMRAKKG